MTGPNNYTLPPVMSKTIQSGKIQAPVFTMVGRSNVGAFCEDLAKVIVFIFVLLTHFRLIKFPDTVY